MDNSIEMNTEGLFNCRIYSNQSKIKDHFYLVSIRVHREVNCIARALLILDAGEMRKQNVPECEDDTFNIGKHIRVDAG